MQSIWDPMQFMHMCMCGSKSHHDSQSAISPVLKCQERVQALTCPHVLLSPVAATGIKLSHVLVWAGKSKIGVQESGCAAGWWWCTLRMYHPVTRRSFACEDPQRHIFRPFTFQSGVRQMFGAKVWRAVKRHSSTDKITGSLVFTSDWQGYVIKMLQNLGLKTFVLSSPN